MTPSIRAGLFFEAPEARLTGGTIGIAHAERPALGLGIGPARPAARGGAFVRRTFREVLLSCAIDGPALRHIHAHGLRDVCEKRGDLELARVLVPLAREVFKFRHARDHVVVSVVPLPIRRIRQTTFRAIRFSASGVVAGFFGDRVVDGLGQEELPQLMKRGGDTKPGFVRNPAANASSTLLRETLLDFFQSECGFLTHFLTRVGMA